MAVQFQLVGWMVSFLRAGVVLQGSLRIIMNVVYLGLSQGVVKQTQITSDVIHLLKMHRISNWNKMGKIINPQLYSTILALGNYFLLHKMVMVSSMLLELPVVVVMHLF